MKSTKLLTEKVLKQRTEEMKNEYHLLKQLSDDEKAGYTDAFKFRMRLLNWMAEIKYFRIN